MKVSVDYFDQTGLPGSSSSVSESDAQSFEALLDDATEVDDEESLSAASEAGSEGAVAHTGTATASESGSSSEGESDSGDEQIALFFDRIRAAGGALAFMQNLNMEKIEKLIEEKRLELEAKFDVANLEGDALANAVSAIDDMLADFRKDLMDDMKKRSGAEGFDQDTFLKQLIHSPSLKSSESEEVV